MKNSFVFSSNLQVGQYLSFAVCAGSFLLGTFAGTAISLEFSPQVRTIEFILSFLNSIELLRLAHSFPLTLAVIFSFPLIALLFAYTYFGFAVLPFFMACSGMFLSFSVAVAARVLGSEGFIPIIVLFGFTSLLQIPCYLILSSKSCYSSFSLLGSSLRSGRQVPLSFVLFPRRDILKIIAVLFSAVLFEVYFKVPVLQFLQRL